MLHGGPLRVQSRVRLPGSGCQQHMQRGQEQEGTGTGSVGTGAANAFMDKDRTVVRSDLPFHI